jgi:wobble nucleotide-excising tRNase
MLSKIKLVQQIGQFENVSSQIDLGPLSIVYAENGRGKTTLVSIFRSLQSGENIPIRERKRLGAVNNPKVVLSFTDEQNDIIFENGAWSKLKSNILIFDEKFINDNIFSGLVVQSPQREGLHGLIVGAQGVLLLRALQGAVADIEEHNKKLRTLSAAFPTGVLRGLTIDQFCALGVLDSADDKIDEARKSLSAARQQESIVQMVDFETLPFAPISPESMDAELGKKLADISSATEMRVISHISKLGLGGESWLAEGVSLAKDHETELGNDCPFCAQSLARSELAQAYSAHFSEAYENLKARISRLISRLDEIYGSSAIERIKGVFNQNRTKWLFWNEFTKLEPLNFDIVQFITIAEKVKRSLTIQLEEKAGAPLEPLSLTLQSKSALAELAVELTKIKSYNGNISSLNEAIAKIKESVSVISAQTVQNELNRLEAARDRQDHKIAARCDTYLAEVAAKKATEALRAKSRKHLEHHLAQIFPAFQAAINAYLLRLNAGFRIDGVKSQNSRRGPSCVYNIVIDSYPNYPISITQDLEGEPSFKTALSTSDRNTLALAVFLASVDMDPEKQTATVLIDDPINSLDEHRQHSTLTEIRRLATEVPQVVVMSHSRPLACQLWETKGQIGKTAIELARAGTGSILRLWDVSAHGVTEHDKRHAKLREYLANQSQNSREIAEAIRPSLEAFLRVAYPAEYPPGTLVGQFLTKCDQRVGGVTEILAQYDINELKALKDYGNLFHHDTNPAYQTADINDAQLVQYVTRTLNFAKRG